MTVKTLSVSRFETWVLAAVCVGLRVVSLARSCLSDDEAIDTSLGNVAAYGKFPPSNFHRLQTLLQRDYRPVGEAAGILLLLLREGRD